MNFDLIFKLVSMFTDQMDFADPSLFENIDCRVDTQIIFKELLFFKLCFKENHLVPYNLSTIAHSTVSCEMKYIDKRNSANELQPYFFQEINITVPKKKEILLKEAMIKVQYIVISKDVDRFFSYFERLNQGEEYNEFYLSKNSVNCMFQQRMLFENKIIINGKPYKLPGIIDDNPNLNDVLMKSLIAEDFMYGAIYIEEKINKNELGTVPIHYLILRPSNNIIIDEIENLETIVENKKPSSDYIISYNNKDPFNLTEFNREITYLQNCKATTLNKFFKEKFYYEKKSLFTHRHFHNYIKFWCVHPDFFVKPSRINSDVINLDMIKPKITTKTRYDYYERYI